MKFLLELDLVSQELVVVLLFGPKLVLDVLVRSLDHFLVGEEVFDLIGLFTVQFVLQTFVGDLSLSLELGLELLIFAVSKLFLLSELVTEVVELLGDLGQHLHLDVQELDFHLHFFRLLLKLLGHREGILVVLHTEKVLLNLFKVFL